VRVTGSGFIVADITAGEFTYRETLNNV